jgi:hypothetical protein
VVKKRRPAIATLLVSMKTVRRDAAVGAFGDKAADMTLRLDSARALPHAHGLNNCGRQPSSQRDNRRPERPAY